MTPLEAWLGRLESRWRRWLRDPAGFFDDLPSRPLRLSTLFGLMGFTALTDVLDRRGARAADLWRGDGVRLVRAQPDGAVFHFLTDDNREPELWPDRLLVDADAGAVIVAFSEDGGLATATEVGPGRPGVIWIGRRKSWARVYRTDESVRAPDTIAVRPVGRDAVIRFLHSRGKTYAEGMRTVWPPLERRPTTPSARAYAAWIARNEPGPSEAAAIEAWLARLAGLPRIAVLMPVHDPRPAHLSEAIESVRGQIHQDWRLCLTDDGSTSSEVRGILEAAVASDPRILLVRHETAQGVAAATNAAMALAEADVALFLDHDDRLAPHALALVAATFAGRPDVAAVYSDEDSIDAEGRRFSPVFKSDLDRERLLAQNYVNHLFAIRLDLLRRLGGLRRGVDGAQDHDLIVRVLEADPGPIEHIPHVLYHWRSFPGGNSLSQRGKAVADAARARLVGEHLTRSGVVASPQPGPRGHLIVERPMPEPAPPVLAIIPTRDRPGLLEACVVGLLEQTDYPALQVCVVDNGSRSPEALKLLEALASTPRVRVLSIDAPFNFSALNNTAARKTDARLLAFINDDIMVIEPGWLKAMVALAVQPDVGAVGAKLFYPDGRLQHAGIVLGLGPQKVAGHEFRGAPGDSSGPQNRLLLAHEASAVTAACMVVESRKFEQVGGFDAEALPVAFNDVDLCLKLGAAGYRTLWTPRARLMHLESATRGTDKSGAASMRFAAEARVMRERWAQVLGADPYYSPNLTLEDESFTLADQSRAATPWR